ncbi:hypothetical protein E4T52_12254 [Aureobasidium sp. EXF-3400]|nr:hypothetical protein E4T51_11221 [Aureobasidium sp. EXF-12344]KAI4772769.1 hypothetical protein E4T52_12254 [Aureobasidium sp. EXF-3400]
MADRSSYRHSSASDSDSQHTFHIAQNAPSILPKPPAPAVLRNSSGDLNEKQDNGFDHDLEKQANKSPRRTLDMTERYNPYSNRIPYDRSSVSSDDSDHLVEHLESKAIKILLYLSGPCVLVSFLLCVWSLVITFFTVLTYPLRLFSASRQPLSNELRSLLARSNRVQLRAIYSSNITQGKSVSSLLLVHALSPFTAMAVSLSAWAVAIYWVFAAMIGDPDGTEGGNDGRATVLGLRAYWEMWLCKAMVQ